MDPHDNMNFLHSMDLKDSMDHLVCVELQEHIQPLLQLTATTVLQANPEETVSDMLFVLNNTKDISWKRVLTYIL